MSDVKLYLGDCLELMKGLQDHSIDAVITDLPYPREFEHLYGLVAKESKRVLRIGGSFLTLCGHYQLARILPDIAQHLKYRWVIKYDQPGAHARMAMGIIVTWKPMLWFVNEKLSPPRNVTDSAISGKRQKNSGHPWEQDLDYALWGIENLTDVGNTVLDPFMGSGTTAIACLQTNRNFIGMEKEKEYFDNAKLRIGQYKASLGETDRPLSNNLVQVRAFA